MCVVPFLATKVSYVQLWYEVDEFYHTNSCNYPWRNNCRFITRRSRSPNASKTSLCGLFCNFLALYISPAEWRQIKRKEYETLQIDRKNGGSTAAPEGRVYNSLTGLGHWDKLVDQLYASSNLWNENPEMAEFSCCSWLRFGWVQGALANSWRSPTLDDWYWLQVETLTTHCTFYAGVFCLRCHISLDFIYYPSFIGSTLPYSIWGVWSPRSKNPSSCFQVRIT